MSRLGSEPLPIHDAASATGAALLQVAALFAVFDQWGLERVRRP